MDLNKLKEKYPFITKCVEVYEGQEYLNTKKAKQYSSIEFERDLLSYEGFVIIDSDEPGLDGFELIKE